MTNLSYLSHYLMVQTLENLPTAEGSSTSVSHSTSSLGWGPDPVGAGTAMPEIRKMFVIV